MKKAATLSSKNQVTIPREVRTALGLKAGETVMFHIEDGGHGATVTLHRNKSLKEVAGSVPTPEEVVGLSWDEIRSRAWVPATQPQGESPAGD